MDISVVIPLYNEAESLPELFAWIQRVMAENHFTYEIIFVDDGSTDGSWDVIEGFRKQSPAVRGRIPEAISGSKGDPFPAQLWQVAGVALRFPACARRCGDHDGCRPAG